jgi:hypothetical protein
MKRIRMVALALVAVFAMAAMASSAGAAQPEFYGKAVVGGTVPHISFTGTLGAAFLEGKSGTKITCTAGTAVGEVTTSTVTENNNTTFTGCESSGFPCENAGAGTITTVTLKGVLGNVVAAKTPGIRLFPQTGGRGGELAAFSCASGAIAVKVKGSVIGSLSGASGKTPAEGKLAASNKLTFAEAKGIQKYVKFVAGEGEAGEEQLESSVGGAAFEKSGQSVIATLKTTPAGQLGVTL